MATNPFLVEDYLEVARSRVTEQFKYDPTSDTGAKVFDKYLQLLINAQVEIQKVFKDLMQLRSLDTATGAQLDVIGRIVGQERILLNADFYDFFGFQGAVKAASFGELGNPSVGGLFYDFGKPLGGNIELDDATYRLFIKAKIFKNTTTSTPEEFLAVLNLVFGTDTTVLTEEGDASITVLLSRALTDFERALLFYISNEPGYPSRLIPKTVGVRINFGEYDGDNFFGFDGVPGAKGFGEFTGSYGWGLGYGLNYGDSDYTTVSGGYFASLYQI